MSHFVYILKCSDDSLYCGYTTDVERRLQEHNGIGDTKTAAQIGAKYTRGRRPVVLAFTKGFKTRSEAMKCEAEIKKLSRAEKIQLIS